MKNLITCLIVFFSWNSYGFAENLEWYRGEIIPQEYRKCQTDRDCIRVPSTNICSSKGDSIHKKYFELYKEIFQEYQKNRKNAKSLGLCETGFGPPVGERITCFQNACAVFPFLKQEEQE